MSQENKNEQLVIAYFADEAVAKSAVTALKDWDKADESIQLGNIGFLTKGDDGKIKQHVERSMGKGILIGAGIGLLVALLPGVALAGGLIGGGVLGGAVGALTKKGLGLTQEDMEEINQHLDIGHAVVVVMLDEAEVEATTAELASLGGTDAKAFNMSSAALPEAAKAVDEAVAGAADATSQAVEGASDAAASAAGAATDAAAAAGDAAQSAASSASDAAKGASDAVKGG